MSAHLPTHPAVNQREPSASGSTAHPAATQVSAPSRICADAAVHPTIPSLTAPLAFPREAQSTIRVPAPATAARERVQLLAENILPPVYTPINVVILERKLSRHPNCDFSISLINALRYGTRIGYTGPEKHRVSRNLISAKHHPEVVSSNLTEEI